MVLPMVAGYLLARPSDSGNTDQIMAQVGFNHPEKYGQIHNGKGTGALTRSVQSWQSDIASDFDEVASLLDEANARAGVAWTGEAAEQHGGSLKPMTNFVRDAKQVSTSVGDSAQQQVENFSNVKHGMPEPVQVDASDSMLEKGAAALFGGETDLQRQEREATEKAEEAKRLYENYDQSTSDVSQGLAYYPKAPEMAFDPGAGGPQQNGSINSPIGAGSGGSAQPVGGSGGSGVGGGSGAGSGGAGLSGGGVSSSPAGTESSWTTPPSGPVNIGNGPGGLPPGGTGPGTGTGPFAGGLLPGTAGGGAGAGRGGMGTGGRGGGLGSGAGRGGAGQPGAGARGGAGALGTGARRAGAGARGGAGAMGAAGARGRGQEGEDDFEHENKYMLPTDEAWEELGLPKVAPPVLGDWSTEGNH